MAAPIELLRRVPLFDEFPRRDLERLAQTFKERTFEAGDQIATEGKAGIGFFVIEDGEAAVTVGGEPRATLRAGDYFGEIALIDEGVRTATVTATTRLRCHGLTAWDFRPLVETNAALAWVLLKAMAKRLRAAEQR